MAVYSGFVAPLGKHFFTSRLLKEKNVTNLMLEERSASQILNGYNSPTLNILAQPPAIPASAPQETTEALSRATNMKYKVETGASSYKKTNTVVEFQGAAGFDYDGDGNQTAIGGAFAGTTFPPNQKKLEWGSFADSYDILDPASYRVCTYAKTDAKYKLGTYKAPWFQMDETECYKQNSERGISEGGYMQMSGTPLAFNGWITPTCMKGHVENKHWSDDCPSDLSQYDSKYAIDSISGAPWSVQISSQLVMGVDNSVSSYDISTGTNFTATHFPIMTLTTTLELNQKDGDAIVAGYDLAFLLKDVISWVLFGMGMFFSILGNILTMTSITKVAAVVDSSQQQEMKPVA